MAKYYKLGSSSSIFWDPSQVQHGKPEKVLAGQVVELEVTPSVQVAYKNNGLIEVTKEDFEKYQKEQEKIAAEEAKKAPAMVSAAQTLNVSGPTTEDYLEIVDELKALRKRQADSDARIEELTKASQKPEELTKASQTPAATPSVTPAPESPKKPEEGKK